MGTGIGRAQLRLLGKIISPFGYAEPSLLTTERCEGERRWWCSRLVGVASHIRWKMGGGLRFLAVMLRGGCDGFGDAAVCLGAGPGMEELGT